MIKIRNPPSQRKSLPQACISRQKQALKQRWAGVFLLPNGKKPFCKPLCIPLTNAQRASNNLNPLLTIPMQPPSYKCSHLTLPETTRSTYPNTLFPHKNIISPCGLERGAEGEIPGTCESFDVVLDDGPANCSCRGGNTVFPHRSEHR